MVELPGAGKPDRVRAGLEPAPEPLVLGGRERPDQADEEKAQSDEIASGRQCGWRHRITPLAPTAFRRTAPRSGFREWRSGFPV